MKTNLSSRIVLTSMEIEKLNIYIPTLINMDLAEPSFVVFSPGLYVLIYGEP